MNANEMKKVEEIRANYVVGEPTKLDELKALNKKVKKPAKVFSYIFGTVGALVMGTGMCFAMKVIGNMMLGGIGIGLAGIAMVSLTYPIYKAMLNSRRKKYADRVIAISDELLNA